MALISTIHMHIPEKAMIKLIDVTNKGEVVLPPSAVCNLFTDIKAISR